MLARSLERTGGPEEEGVRMFKDELRESVLKKDSNRLGDFEDNEFYLVSTLCDPRCFLNQVALQDLSFRFKDSFFLSNATGRYEYCTSITSGTKGFSRFIKPGGPLVSIYIDTHITNIISGSFFLCS